MLIGLRVDVDTFRGTRYGVPNLLRLFAGHDIKASFFFCVGPDNMGRHLRRLFNPAFLRKMLRTRAPGLYGWDILLRGTIGTGPVIGERLGHIIRWAADAGHEVGLHAWDHHAWQTLLDSMDAAAIHQSLEHGFDLLAAILGRPPVSSAVPAWKCNDLVLVEKARFPFLYNSDCRGQSIFRPIVGGKELEQPQIPVTLPTYDEVVGHIGVSDATYNNYLLSRLKPEGLNVLTVHAEVEGISRLTIFDRFLKAIRARNASLVPLGALLTDLRLLDRARIVAMGIPGREGWGGHQGK